MSLILDALNRAEQERSEKNHIPSLQSMHGSTDVVRPSLLQRLHLERWLIVLVVAYLVFDYFTDKPADSPVVPAPLVVQETQPKVAPIRQIVKLPQSLPTEPLPTEPLPAEPFPTGRTPPSPATETEPVSRTANSSEIESLYAAPPVAEVDEPAASPRPKPAIADTPSDRPPADSTPVARHEAPLAGREQSYARADDITDLSLSIRQQIPSIKYSDHMPASQPVDSRAVLNGSVHKEGDQLAPGLIVKSISTKGVVLEFQGAEFRLEAYNNWINFQ